ASDHVCTLSLHDALPISDLRGAALADAAGRGQVLLLEHRPELGPLDHAELLRRRELVAEHSREIVAGAAVPPCGRRVILEIRHRSEEHTSELQSLAYLVC